MAAHTHFETLDVFPCDHQSLVEITRYELSDIDQQLTGNHTTPCVVYPFAGNKDDVVKNLQLGLQNVLTCIPFVGGELSNEGGRLSVVRKNHEPIRLGVHSLDEDAEFPTYESLAATGFPAQFFSDNASRLTPPASNLGGFRRDDGCPVAVFQANFIKGGIILTLPLHHICGDAKSIDHTFRLWAASTHAAAHKASMPMFRPSLDRTYFNAASVPIKDEIQALKANIRGFSFHPIKRESLTVGLTEPPQPPPMSIVMYHFSTSECEELKRLCQPAPESDVKFVSSYDVICALTWRAMTRARIPYLKPDLGTAKTEYAHPVDTRGRFDGAVPNAYFGNGFMMIPTAPILVSQLTGDGGLANAAQLIRQATQSLTVHTIPDLVRLRRGIEGEEDMRWIWHPENVVGTSWSGMRAMQTYDFGFGLPVSLRLPVPPFEGVLGVLPASSVDGNVDGFDVYVVLEDGCQERLRADPEYAKYCSVVGA